MKKNQVSFVYKCLPIYMKPKDVEAMTNSVFELKRFVPLHPRYSYIYTKLLPIGTDYHITFPAIAFTGFKIIIS